MINSDSEVDVERSRFYKFRVLFEGRPQLVEVTAGCYNDAVKVVNANFGNVENIKLVDWRLI